jgi:outer membrane protein assembly factor BamB
MRRNGLLGGVVATILLSVGTVQAAFDEGTIGVSFGGKDAAPVGKAVVGSDGDKWNAPEGQEGQAIALSDVKGAKTDVRLTFDADRTYDAVNDSPFLGGPYENLLRHYLVAVQEHQLALKGLTPGAHYSLYLYSASNPGGNNRVTKFTVGTQTKSTTFSMENKEFTPGVNYTRFTVVADKEGNVSLTYSGGEGPEGNLNGLQIMPAKGNAVATDDTPRRSRVETPPPRTGKRPGVAKTKSSGKTSRAEVAARKPKLESSSQAAKAEWPCWRGPNHDGKSLDKGLLKQWPDDGPSLLWKVDDIGAGFSSVAVTGGKVFISGDRDGKLMIFAFDLDGNPSWKAEHGTGRGGPDGSRASPVIDNGNLYILNGNGLVGCYDAASGEKKWTREAKEFGGSPGGWGYSESVLIYKNLAIFKPGGKNCIVALDKATGETVWKSTGFDAGPEYGSCLPVTFEGQEMIVTGTNRGIVAVDAQSGKMLWSNDWSSGNTANCPTPAYADGYIFWANGYGRGGVCLKLGKDDGKVTADVAWTTKEMVCHHGGYVIHEGYIYGNHDSGWTCLDLKSGKKQWHERAVGKGSLCFADDMLYLFSENSGQAGLATCSPDGLKLEGKMKVEGSGPSWAHPVVIGGRLYLRYYTHLYCFSVKNPD